MRIGVGDGTQTNLLVLSDAWDGNHARAIARAIRACWFWRYGLKHDTGASA